jgi:phosphoheptose isomerase
MKQELEHLVKKYSDLYECIPDIERAFELIAKSYHQGGKLLLCGNGGSAADCEHIAGELMKGFTLQRPVDSSFKQRLIEGDSSEGTYIAEHLQQALPAISLVSHSALITAFANDVAADMIFAQQVYGYGQHGDVVMGLSTSGNSNNILKALKVANAMGLKTVGLTGQSGGAMKDVCDVSIRVPWHDTLDIQERHLPIYHALCIMLEKEFFQS